MADDDGLDGEMSIERKAAELAFAKAREELQRGHTPQAIDLARDALMEDPTHLDVRRWLAQLYEGMEETTRASRELQELIHANREDEEAWEALRRVDQAAAARLERLHDIAPDPFVATRKPVTDDIFGDMGTDEEEEEEEELATGDTEGMELEAVGVESEQAEDEGVEVSEVAEEAVPEAAEEAPPAPTEAQVPWAFEQDYEFRRRLMARGGVASIVEKLNDMADDYDAWETALVGCAHLDKERWGHVHELAEELSGFFGVQPPVLFMAPERRMMPAVIGGDPVMMALTTGMINALSEVGLRFMMGRLMAYIALSDIVYHHITTIVLQRTPTSMTDVEEALTDLLVRTTLGWDVGVSREDAIKTGKIAHAWQQRAVLSADRAGLLACKDLDAACLVIAQGTARDSDKAAQMKLADFVAEYKGQDPRQLAATSEKEDPLRSSRYGAYRILMLRWWAATDQYGQLVNA